MTKEPNMIDRFAETFAPRELTQGYFNMARLFNIDPMDLLDGRKTTGIYHDVTYNKFLKWIQTGGRQKGDRTGTGTLSRFGYQMRFDIRNGVVPLLTGKKMHLPAIIHEIIWYLSGSSNIKYLQDNGVRIWNEWADENGELGPVYGFQWRNWPVTEVLGYEDSKVEGDDTYYVGAVVREGRIDQIKQLREDLLNNPDSRRLMVSAWNVGQIQDMKLPPCHYTFQFYTEEMTREERVEWLNANTGTECTTFTDEHMDYMKVPKRFISCMMNQRSADAFLGVPFNISQYAIITHLFGKVLNMAPREFIWSGGDCHIYNNLKDQVEEQLKRIPYESPRIKIADSVDNLENLKYNDFEVLDYRFHPAIKGQVAV